MDNEIKVGDVVMLKSNGPRMTVEEIAKYSSYSEEEKAKCVWFDGSKKMEDLFVLTSLKVKND